MKSSITFQFYNKSWQHKKLAHPGIQLSFHGVSFTEFFWLKIKYRSLEVRFSSSSNGSAASPNLDALLKFDCKALNQTPNYKISNCSVLEPMMRTSNRPTATSLPQKRPQTAVLLSSFMFTKKCDVSVSEILQFFT